MLLAGSILASVVAAVAAGLHGPGGLRTVALLLHGVTGAVSIAGLVIGLADPAGRGEAMRWIVLNGVVAAVVVYFLSGLLAGR